MAKNEKSKAEIYREERKARISSAAKKSSKKKIRSPKLIKAIKVTVSTVICVAIAAGITYFALDNAGVFVRMQTAFSIGETKISVAEYGYMYYMRYNNTVNTSYQYYQQYGYDVYGFDYNASPKEQESNYTDDDGKKLMWDEYLVNDTVDFLREFYVIYNEAVSKGYTLTEDEKKDIDDQIEEMRKTAAGDQSNESTQNISMSLNSYLKAYYGKGITERFMRDIMEKQAITQRYSEDKQQEFKDKYTDDKLDAEYKKDVDSYDVVNLRAYKFDKETLKADKGETDKQLKERQAKADKELKAKADAFLEKIKDEASFLTVAEEQNAAAEAAKASKEDKTAEKDDKTDKSTEDKKDTEEDADEDAEAEKDEDAYDADESTKNYYKDKKTITSSYSEKAATWAFENGRKAGDKQVFESDTAYFVLYMAKTQYKLNTVDVRHILFMTVDSSTGEDLSEDEIKEKKAKCDTILKQWKDSKDKSEDYFAQLADENSEDTGSNTKGGLYEGVTPGQMVSEFDKWIFDKGRKTGDVDVVKSDYGYHIMYFVGNPSFKYRIDLRTSHTQDDYSGWLEKNMDDKSNAVAKNEKYMKIGYDRAYVLIDKTVENIKNSSQNQNGTAQ